MKFIGGKRELGNFGLSKPERIWSTLLLSLSEREMYVYQ